MHPIGSCIVLLVDCVSCIRSVAGVFVVLGLGTLPSPVNDPWPQECLSPDGYGVFRLHFIRWIVFVHFALHLIVGAVCSQLGSLDCLFVVDCHTSLECHGSPGSVSDPVVGSR